MDSLSEMDSGKTCAWCGKTHLPYGEIKTFYRITVWVKGRTRRETVTQCKKCSEDYKGTRFWNCPPGSKLEQLSIFDLGGRLN